MPTASFQLDSPALHRRLAWNPIQPADRLDIRITVNADIYAHINDTEPIRLSEHWRRAHQHLPPAASPDAHPLSGTGTHQRFAGSNGTLPDQGQRPGIAAPGQSAGPPRFCTR